MWNVAVETANTTDSQEGVQYSRLGLQLQLDRAVGSDRCPRHTTQAWKGKLFIYESKSPTGHHLHLTT